MNDRVLGAVSIAGTRREAAARFREIAELGLARVLAECVLPELAR